jgi:hypothetical protein
MGDCECFIILIELSILIPKLVMAYICAGVVPEVTNTIPDEQAYANDRFAMMDASLVSCSLIS